MKNCKNCQKEKKISEFSEQKSRNKVYVNNICIECMQQKQKEYRKNNKAAKKKINKDYYERIKLTPNFILASKEYRHNCKVYKRKYDKKYREDHKEEYRNYCVENVEKISEVRHNYYLKNKKKRKEYNQKWYADNKSKKHANNTKYILKRLKKDISFRLRSNFSKTIRHQLKLIGSSKNNNSILKFLSYNVEELKSHIEKQFEPWMTWKNYGVYCVETWDDNDSLTWTWNIDHIVPQSDLSYTSMEDNNFKKCWSLENLRPYSSKQNQLDGITKVRHKVCQQTKMAALDILLKNSDKK
jgi:hypothetical protein